MELDPLQGRPANLAWVLALGHGNRWPIWEHHSEEGRSQQAQGQARKGLAFDPILSADFFLFHNNSS